VSLGVLDDKVVEDRLDCRSVSLSAHPFARERLRFRSTFRGWEPLDLKITRSRFGLTSRAY
jgi:hypothetical protein